MKKFVPIKRKLILRTMGIICLSFIIVLSAVTWMNIESVNHNIKKSERNIKNSIITKGSTLVDNNSIALKSMVGDNAFIDIQELVASTVKGDVDIVYGIYMNKDYKAWASASRDNTSGIPKSNDELSDDASKWAGSIHHQSHNTFSYKDDTVIEFAAPVVIDNEILGFIRYGISTKSMYNALQDALEDGIQTRNQAIIIILSLGLVSLIITYFIIKKLAQNITKPIEKLLVSSKKIAEGDYNSEVKLSINDEIGDLADNFEVMRVTIKKYTDHLQELVDEKMKQVKDILNNIDQGLFTINLDGTVNEEYSAKANEILKVSDIASCTLHDILRLTTEQEKSFDLWLEVVKKKHLSMRWTKLEHLSPVRNLELPYEEGTSFISISYERIMDKNGNLSKLMVLAIDETEKRLKDIQIKEEKRRHENEMKIILGIANTPQEEILEFLKVTNASIDFAHRTIAKHIEEFKQYSLNYSEDYFHTIPPEEVNEVYRDIHTIKGNSGSYGFDELALCSHKVEDMMDTIRKPININNKYLLNDIINKINDMSISVNQIQEKYKLIYGEKEECTIEVPLSRIDTIKNIIYSMNKRNLNPEAKQLVFECSLLSWKPLKALTRKYYKIVNKTSRKLGKKIDFVVSNETLLQPEDIFNDIDDILVHILRNAVDHGIESVKKREKIGKGKGIIRFDYQNQGRERVISISDNGQGINIEKLLEVCIRKGIIKLENANKLSPEEKLNLIFYPGVSTTESISEISGRGVGLDVVKQKIISLKGSISVDSWLNKGSVFTIIVPNF
ncbi:MAG: HAMP domain-containing protein [Desulfobacterales bacterium]|nr:HAMP domain-containing protein [Desulfobacterales bacterium]